MSDDPDILGVAALIVFILVYLISILLTGSLWGPFVFLIQLICDLGGDSFTICR